MVHAKLVCALELLCEREVGSVGCVDADGGGAGGGQKSGFGGGEGEDVGWMGCTTSENFQLANAREEGLPLSIVWRVRYCFDCGSC